MKKKGIIILISLIAVVAIIGGTVVALAASGRLNANTKPTSSTNPDDAVEYIQYKTNEYNGYEYSWKSGTVEKTTLNEVGKIVLDSDYMYVYGMYYNSTNTPNTTSTTGWVNQSTVTGWGCVARSKTKTSYNVPYGSINNEKVTYFSRCYQNCTNMTTYVSIPATAENAQYAYAGCTGLSEVVLNGITKIDSYMFNGCSNLKNVFIGTSVSTIIAPSAAAAPFYGVHSTCKCYVEKSSAPSGYGTYWRSIGASNTFASVKYSADYMIDFVNR